MTGQWVTLLSNRPHETVSPSIVSDAVERALAKSGLAVGASTVWDWGLGPLTVTHDAVKKAIDQMYLRVHEQNLAVDWSTFKITTDHLEGDRTTFVASVMGVPRDAVG